MKKNHFSRNTTCKMSSLKLFLIFAEKVLFHDLLNLKSLFVKMATGGNVGLAVPHTSQLFRGGSAFGVDSMGRHMESLCVVDAGGGTSHLQSNGPSPLPSPTIGDVDLCINMESIFIHSYQYLLSILVENCTL